MNTNEERNTLKEEELKQASGGVESHELPPCYAKGILKPTNCLEAIDHPECAICPANSNRLPAGPGSNISTDPSLRG